MKRTLISLAMMFLISGFCGCAKKMPYDYTAFRQHPPRSILVIPPLNNTTDVNATYSYLSTITKPLAECGYYVFPVAVIDAFLKENGMPTPGEMNQVPLAKVRKIIGADAVLYVTIDDWGQKYEVLSSDTVVSVRARLVDVDSGTTLWEGHVSVHQSPDNSGSGLIGMAIGAVVDQIVGSLTDKTHTAAATANNLMIFNPDTGLPYGPYNPKSATDPRR